MRAAELKGKRLPIAAMLDHAQVLRCSARCHWKPAAAGLPQRRRMVAKAAVVPGGGSSGPRLPQAESSVPAASATARIFMRDETIIVESPSSELRLPNMRGGACHARALPHFASLASHFFACIRTLAGAVPP